MEEKSEEERPEDKLRRRRTEAFIDTGPPAEALLRELAAHPGGVKEALDILGTKGDTVPKRLTAYLNAHGLENVWVDDLGEIQVSKDGFSCRPHVPKKVQSFIYAWYHDRYHARTKGS